MRAGSVSHGSVISVHQGRPQVHRATPTAILGAMEPLTAVVIGVTVFGERLTWTDTAGLLLILVAVTMVILQGTVAHWLARVRYLFPRKHRR